MGGTRSPSDLEATVSRPTRGNLPPYLHRVQKNPSGVDVPCLSLLFLSSVRLCWSMQVAETSVLISCCLPSFQNDILWNKILNEAASRLRTAPAAKNCICYHRARNLESGCWWFAAWFVKIVLPMYLRVRCAGSRSSPSSCRGK